MLQAFVHDAFNYIERIHADGGHNGYKMMYQRCKAATGAGVTC